MNQKRIYEAPQSEMIGLDMEDVVRTSDPITEPTTGGGPIELPDDEW